MQKKLRRFLFRVLIGIIAFPILYFLFALILSYIPVNTGNKEKQHSIYLSSNGVHLDLIIPRELIDSSLLSGLQSEAPFLGFGWGDENFYLNTPEWKDLTVSNAANALLWPSTTLVHLSPYQRKRDTWKTIPLDSLQLQKMNSLLLQAFTLKDGWKQQIPNASYGYGDTFYRANGSYSCFKTCNSWVNSILDQCDLPACLWTPFDFAVLDKY